MASERQLEIAWLGRLGYAAALALQNDLVEQRRHDLIADRLLLLEHDRVLTFGHRAGTRHLLVDVGTLHDRGVDLFETDRGGDITYHGPGQLVGYLIMQLLGSERSVPGLFARLETAIADALSSFGIAAAGGTPQTTAAPAELPLAGVWVGRDKICALGLKISEWITKHGFALNVDPNLLDFQMIVPCGLADRGVTSMAKLLGAAPPADAVRQRIGTAIARAFERQAVWL